MANWVSLHTHSQYSILDSTASVKGLAARAKKLGCPALALTDFGNLYGAVDFYKACVAEDVRPIIGCELMMAPNSRTEKKKTPGVPVGTSIILLVKNDIGYHNLCKLTSTAHVDGFYYFPRIDKEVLAQHSEGVICLSGPLTGQVSRLILQEEEETLKSEIEWFCRHFGEDYYFEIHDHRMEDTSAFNKESWLQAQYEDFVAGQARVRARMKELSQDYGIPCVATNDVHYLDASDWKAHEILMNIQSGEPCEKWEYDSFGNPKSKVPNPKRQVTSSHEHYFKSPAQMSERFDLESLATSLAIAEKCRFEIDFSQRFYPVFVPPELENTDYTLEERQQCAETYLRERCSEALSEKYSPDKLGAISIEEVKKRLDYELEVITSKGMGDYLLIVRDFIAWAKKQGIPVGPGRGSGAGSIVLYLLGITDIEPIRFSLFFERFINPERLSYPDIDVDICMERRSEVIDYTLRKYGHENVAQIITFGTMKAKMVIRDVGRVLNVPLAKVNKIAKLVPDDLGMTLEKALEIDHDLRELCRADDEAHQIIEYGKKLEGSIRSTGIHAAGLIISGDPLTDHIPVCAAKDSDIFATQYSMKPAEAVGMLKIDFLGLKTLTSIQKAVDTIAKTSGKQIDWVNLPLDDSTTFNLLNQGKTTGIFQLESGGMQDLVRQLQIDKFEEVIAVGALYRPGPMEMIPSFINRKHGREPIEYDHPWMEDILAETYGIMIYQEQVMQIAQKLAGYSLGEGDVLRKAMGKKDHVEMERQREKFKNGAIENGIDEKLAIAIFEKVQKFASYGFNKSHATAYGYLSYVTAYLKANYPMEWQAALMTCDIDDLTKVAKHIAEAAEMAIETLPPDINESSLEFFPTEKGIRFALSAIKGVGKGMVEVILAERQQSGMFTSFQNFLERIDTTRVGKKVIEHLIDAGGLDGFGWSRKTLRLHLDPLFETAMREQKEKAKGVMDLFAMDMGMKSSFPMPTDVTDEFPKQELLKKEKELLGFYLSGHPMDEYRDLLKSCACTPLSKVESLKDGAAIKAAFIIETLQSRISKAQKKFAILTISDGIERYELPIWAHLFEEKGHLLAENELLLAVLSIENEDGDIKLRCHWFDHLSEAAAIEAEDALKKAKSLVRSSKKRAADPPAAPVQSSQKLRIVLDPVLTELSHIVAIKKLFAECAGTSPVQIDFNDYGKITIDSNWGVMLSPKLQNGLKQLPCFVTCGLESIE